MSLKKPSDFFNKKDKGSQSIFESSISTISVSSDISERYDNFVNSFEKEKIDDLSERVNILSQQISEKLNKTDLEKAMLSQLMILDENFKKIQNEVKGINKKDLKEFKEKVSSINQLVETVVNIEIPKYKKQITKETFYVDEQLKGIRDTIDENVSEIRNEIDTKFVGIANIVDNNVEYLSNKIQDNYSEVNETKRIYTNLSKVLENKVAQENERLEEFSETIVSIQKELSTFSSFINEEFSIHQLDVDKRVEKYREEISNTQSNLQNFVGETLENYRKDLIDVKSDVAINEQHLKNFKNYFDESIGEIPNKIVDIENHIQENYKQIKNFKNYFDESIGEIPNKIVDIENHIQENYKQIVEVREEVFEEIERLPVGNIQENIERLERKIDFIKETYSKIEPEIIVKEVIKEGLLNEPSETKNSDPLTPLDKNFVTLDQLQEHYRLFINRIQQQLSTLGGGGETQLKYLDDVVGIATNPSAYDGKFLKYNHSTNKFEFSDVDITNDYWANNDQDEVYTLSRVAIGTDRIGTGSTVLLVDGDVRITGILSIGQGTVTIDGNSNEIYVSNIVVQDTIVNSEGVGYATITYVDNAVAISTFSRDYTELFNTPSLLSEFSNDVGFATVTYVDVAISNLIDSAPATLDTLNELAAALSDDSNFATTVTNSLATKANLSGANFTGVVTATTFVGNLTGTASTSSFATTSYTLNGNEQSYFLDYNNFTNTPTIPSDTGDLTNSVGFVTSGIVVGYATEGYVDTQVGLATAGLASETYVGLSTAGLTSETYVNNLVAISTFSGDYNNLTNTPTIPSIVGLASEGYVDNAISNIADSLDTVTGRGNNTTNGISVGILTATSGNFSGIITASGANISGVVTATDFNSASDIKLKNNVTVIDNALDKVSQLDGVSFDWKDTGRSSLGVIAQDVEKVLPELVSGEENKTVNYNGLVGLLIQCVKEQQKEIEELRRLIDK